MITVISEIALRALMRKQKLFISSEGYRDKDTRLSFISFSARENGNLGII